jgi:hypothetical protein
MSDDERPGLLTNAARLGQGLDGLRLILDLRVGVFKTLADIAKLAEKIIERDRGRNSGRPG